MSHVCVYMHVCMLYVCRMHFEAIQHKLEAEVARRAEARERARLEAERRRQLEIEMEQAYLLKLQQQEQLLLIQKWNDKRKIARRGILTMRVVCCENLPPIPSSRYEYRFAFQLRFNAANLPNSITVYTPFFQTDEVERGCVFNQEFKFEVNNAGPLRFAAAYQPYMAYACLLTMHSYVCMRYACGV